MDEGSVCGNGKKEPGEQCDDGNTKDGDGCDSQCKDEVEELCGNGELDPGEECDPPDPENNCSPTCHIEGNVVCSPSPCCGDSVVDNNEECDDGNLENDDGCDEFCKEETGVCSPSPCCGDGNLDGDEECDDGNHEEGDGCTAECKEEQPDLTMGFTGTVNYAGVVTEDDSLNFFLYDSQPPAWDEGEVVVGMSKVIQTEFPYVYEAPAPEAGAYWIVCWIDFGANNPMMPGAEDTGQLYPQVVNVGQDEVVQGISFTLPEPQQVEWGKISGTITYSGQTTGNDELGVMLSKTKPPALQMAIEPLSITPSFPQFYEFPEVPAGSYYVIGSLDLGGDFQMDKMGGWPSAGNNFDGLQKITVGAGQNITGKNFELDADPPQGGPGG